MQQSSEMNKVSPQVPILLLALFVVGIGFGLTLPVLPVFVQRLVLGRGVDSDLVAVHIGALTGSYALAQVFFAPLWGRLADTYRRKPLMLIGLMGYMVSLVVFGGGSSLVVLYAARLVGGTFSAALLPTSAAFLSERLSGSMRSRGFAWMNAATSSGVVAGPLLSGLLTSDEWHILFQFGHFRIDGFSMPFFAAAVLVAISIVLISIGMGEGPDQKGEMPGSRAGRWRLPDQPLRGLLGLAFSVQLGLAVFESTFFLYARSRLGLSLLQIAYGFTVCGVVMTVAQGGVFAALVSRINERTLVVLGFIVSGIGMGGLLLVSEFSGAMIAISVIALGVALVVPALPTLVALASRSHVATALGLQSAAGGMGQFLGAFIGGLIFVWQPNLPNLVAATLMLMAAVWTFRNREMFRRAKE